VQALELALGPEPHERQTWAFALAVNQRGWDLVDNPARLRMQTFDGFCRSLAEQMPWLNRFGTPPQNLHTLCRIAEVTPA